MQGRQSQYGAPINSGIFVLKQTPQNPNQLDLARPRLLRLAEDTGVTEYVVYI